MVNQVNTTDLAPTTASPLSATTLGKDDFLNMLIVQLKNQDPLNPMDGTQFASQLAQFSSLEQLTNLNTSVKSSIDANFLLTQSINNTLTATLVGKNVKLGGNSIVKNGQEKINLGYTLPPGADKVTINIKDANGNIVKTIDSGSTKTGDNNLTWDFTNNNGDLLPDGSYSFEVSAIDTAGNKLNASVFKLGKIDGVKFSNKGTTLLVGGNEYQLSDILEVLDSTN